MAVSQDIEFREPAARAAEAAASGELRDMQGEKMVLNMGPSHPARSEEHTSELQSPC